MLIQWRTELPTWKNHPAVKVTTHCLVKTPSQKVLEFIVMAKRRRNIRAASARGLSAKVDTSRNM